MYVSRSYHLELLSLLAFFCLYALGAGAKLASEFGDFSNPEQVTILGHASDAMEPFITRDGRYLFFNNSNAPAVNTDLHYAERVDDVTFRYRGEIEGVNTPALEGTPTMDMHNNLYFVSPRSYAQTFSTIYHGTFSSGGVSDVSLVPGLSKGKRGYVNFDVEVSPDGNRLNFVESRFSILGKPKTADIVIAERTDSGFVRQADSELVMRQINTSALEYAPSLSSDEREIFFTRFDGSLPAIYSATRARLANPFGKPGKVAAIGGFAEGPSLSSDGRSLYYHKKKGKRFVICCVSRGK